MSVETRLRIRVRILTNQQTVPGMHSTHQNNLIIQSFSTGTLFFLGEILDVVAFFYSILQNMSRRGSTIYYNVFNFN